MQELLEREPNHFELAVFSLLWSEHCGYKHSALLLKRLPSSGPRVLQGPGENAGVLDLGDGLAVTFKAESHNHPSAVEPFQGAATGVGGILRDIIAMGARPVALLDGLRFGAPDSHFSQAVGGDRRVRQLGRGARMSAARSSSTTSTPRTASSTRCASACFPSERVMSAKADTAGALVSSTAPRPGATASAAPRCWRARSSARRTPTSAPPSRSATRSRASG